MNKKVEVKGISVGFINSKQEDYISITDIAKYKNRDAPADIIKNWLRNKNTIELLGLWERLHNPTFNMVEFDQFKNEAVFKRPTQSARDRKRPQETVRGSKRLQEKHALSLEVKKILSYLNENEKISRKDVMALLNCKETKAKNALNELVALELATRIRKGKYTYYIKAEN